MAAKGDQKLYEVDKIVGDKVTNGSKYYRIHWKGYSAKEDTWEPATSLVNCESLVSQYERASTSPSKFSPSRRSLFDKVDTPTRESRSLTRRTTTSFVYTETPSPSRYNFRRSTLVQRSGSGVPCYLTNEPDSPLGYGYERKVLHTTVTRLVEATDSKGETTPITADQPAAPPQPSAPMEDQLEDQCPSDTTTPSWMQLGYAELLFCLSILLVIVICAWLLSTGKLRPTGTTD